MAAFLRKFISNQASENSFTNSREHGLSLEEIQQLQSDIAHIVSDNNASIDNITKVLKSENTIENDDKIRILSEEEGLSLPPEEEISVTELWAKIESADSLEEIMEIVEIYLKRIKHIEANLGKIRDKKYLEEFTRVVSFMKTLQETLRSQTEKITAEKMKLSAKELLNAMKKQLETALRSQLKNAELAAKNRIGDLHSQLNSLLKELNSKTRNPALDLLMKNAKIILDQLQRAQNDMKNSSLIESLLRNISKFQQQLNAQKQGNIARDAILALQARLNAARISIESAKTSSILSNMINSAIASKMQAANSSVISQQASLSAQMSSAQQAKIVQQQANNIAILQQTKAMEINANMQVLRQALQAQQQINSANIAKSINNITSYQAARAANGRTDSVGRYPGCAGGSCATCGRSSAAISQQANIQRASNTTTIAEQQAVRQSAENLRAEVNKTISDNEITNMLRTNNISNATSKLTADQQRSVENVQTKIELQKQEASKKIEAIDFNAMLSAKGQSTNQPAKSESLDFSAMLSTASSPSQSKPGNTVDVLDFSKILQANQQRAAFAG